jgi:hypothetical protein
MPELIKNPYRPKKRANFRGKTEIFNFSLKLFTKYAKKNM